MATQTIGIIVNGATGRIGSTQHLANALVPIIAEGGLALGDDRLLPRLLLAGRDGDAARRGRKRTTARHGPPISTAALADPAYAIFFDAAATQQRVAVLEQGDRRRQARLFREAGGADRSQGARAAAAARAARGSSTARSRTRSTCRACRSSPRSPAAARSGASSASGSNSAGGCSTAATGRASGRAGTTAQGGGGLILDMYPHWRYVIETIVGRIARVPRANGPPRPSASTSGRALRRWTSRTRRHPGRARERRVRHHPELVGDAGAPRRPAHPAGRRHARLGARRPAPLPRAVDAGTRRRSHISAS